MKRTKWLAMLLSVIMIATCFGGTSVFAGTPPVSKDLALNDSELGTLTTGSSQTYKIVLSESGRLTIGLSSMGGALNTANVTVQDALLFTLSAFGDRNWAVPLDKSADLPAGTYYVTVGSKDATATSNGPYAISTRFVRSYKVNVTNTSGGTATANTSYADEDTLITLTATPSAGHKFVSWELTSYKSEFVAVPPSSYQTVITGNATITNPNEATTTMRLEPTYSAVTVVAHFTDSNDVTLTQPLNGGSITADKTLGIVQGSTITLTATPQSGYVFDKWTVISGNVTLGNTLAAQTTFTMPNAGVAVTASFKKQCSITLGKFAGGSVTLDKYTAYPGDTVYITANPDRNTQFQSWSVTGGVTLLNPNSDSTSFVVGTQDIVVSAEFKAVDPATVQRTVSVVSSSSTYGSVSSSSSSGKKGDTITIVAYPTSSGRFDKWEVLHGAVTISSPTNPTETFTIGDTDVSVRAKFISSSNVMGNTITVSPDSTLGGTVYAGATSAVKGTSVRILATPSIGYKFDHWTVLSGSATLTSSSDSDTTFVMGSSNVSIQAVFLASNAVSGGSTAWDGYVRVLNSIATFTNNADAASRLSRLAGGLVVTGSYTTAQPAIIVKDGNSGLYYMNGTPILLSGYGINVSSLDVSNSGYNKLSDVVNGNTRLSVYMNTSTSVREKAVVNANIAAGILVNVGLQPGAGTSLGSSNWADTAVKSAIEAGIVQPEILINYQQAITRAEYCNLAVYTLMAKYGYGNDVDGFVSKVGIDLSKAPFTDIFGAQAKYIKIAYALRIVNGIGNNQFAPEKAITRQEAALMAKNVATVLNYNAVGVPTNFNDKQTIANWATVGVDFASASGIMVGTSSAQFSPLSTYTREQAIVTLMRLYEKLPTNLQNYFSVR